MINTSHIGRIIEPITEIPCIPAIHDSVINNIIINVPGNVFTTFTNGLNNLLINTCISRPNIILTNQIISITSPIGIKVS